MVLDLGSFTLTLDLDLPFPAPDENLKGPNHDVNSARSRRLLSVRTVTGQKLLGIPKEVPMNRIATKLPEPHSQAHRRMPFWLSLALLSLAPAAAVAQTYTAFDCPESFETRARSINEPGDIVGVCEDANGRHGFLLRQGVFTLIDAPDAAAFTVGTGINNRGHVVGHYLDNEDVGHGFLLRHGDFTTIDVPGSPYTFPVSIDERGRIVGFYLGSDEVFRGFLLDSRGFQDIEFPDAVATGAWGINARTWIVGGYLDTNYVPHGFLLKKGTFSSIDFPGGVGTRAFGINSRGHIVGGWSGDPACADCFVNAFLLTPRGFTNLAFPEALETVAWGINAAGQIVGHYFGEDEAFHGFLREPKDQ